MKNPKDEAMCPCCGQMRSYPTKPGRWQFRQYPCLWDTDGELHPERYPWRTVTVKRDPEEGLFIIEDGKEEPMWWPDDAVWRKL